MKNKVETTSAITVSVSGGNVSISYEEKTPENITKRLNQVKDALDVTWYGVAALLGLEPTENNVRLLARWQRDPTKGSAREMPDARWLILLTLAKGQKSVLGSQEKGISKLFKSLTSGE